MSILIENLTLTPNLAKIWSYYEEAGKGSYCAQEFQLC